VRRGILALAGGALGVSILTVAMAAFAEGPDDGSEWSRVVEEARDQMSSHEYDGLVVVEWHDEQGTHRARMEVRQRNGVVEIVADDRKVTRDASRVLLDGQAWTTLARAHSDATPDLTRGKYEITHRDGPDIAGHETTRYEAIRDGAVVERVYVQKGSSLVLRREVLDSEGDVTRAVTFMRVEDAAPAAAPPSTSAAVAGPQPVDDLEKPYRDPATAGDGFRLIGRWRHADELAQLYYSDGVLSVSVFEQPGHLEWSRLPGGGVDAEVRGHRALRYALPVGEAWVFERGGMVYTCVGDASADEFVAIAGDVSRPDESRIERLAEMVVDPFRW
jgi:hypothetical protein